MNDEWMMIIDANRSIFVDPVVGVVNIVNNILISEPEGDLLLGVLNGVRAVADVSASDDAEISSDSSGTGLRGVSGTEEDSAGGDCVLAFPDHADDGAREHVLDEGGEEGSGTEILVVFLKEFSGGVDQLESSEEESSLLEPADDLANESSLDTVGLDHDVGSLSVNGV